ncbi:hypothetical protein ACWEFL_03850 [Streptomyces sp. NPDC004838]
MALLSAAATLIGALFICLSPPADEHPPASGYPVTAFSCPYDNGSCGLRPVLDAAVLTAPPLDDPPVEADQAPRLDQPSGSGGRPRSDALPRAPGLHVLQVLRI